jgi:isoleucyl-tRNA synthetase
LTSIVDDGTVVGRNGVRMSKKVGQTTAGQSTADFIAASQLRFAILDEERLRRSIAYEEDLRRSDPQAWRAREASRRAENREIAETNRRLRTLGLEPLRPEPSLAQRRQELQRLERRNAAETATFRQRSLKSRPKPSGTPLARRRSRRSDD